MSGEVNHMKIRMNLCDHEGKSDNRTDECLAARCGDYGSNSQSNPVKGYHPNNPERGVHFSAEPTWNADPFTLDARVKRLQRKSIVPAELMNVPKGSCSAARIPPITIAGKPLASAMEK